MKYFLQNIDTYLLYLFILLLPIFIWPKTLLLTVFILIYLILLSNGYEMFESRGWNVDTIVLLRKIEHLVLALGCLAGCIFLGRFYLLRVRAWKRGEQVSGYSLKIESVSITLFILGPALVLLYFSIKIGFTVARRI